ncbi:MAG: hypothetical protein KUG82_15770 [Pseudomonadales bacterium]|nr:hypothetical protein [Pseudomonadales bacterium]
MATVKIEKSKAEEAVLAKKAESVENVTPAKTTEDSNKEEPIAKPVFVKEPILASPYTVKPASTATADSAAAQAAISQTTSSQTSNPASFRKAFVLGGLSVLVAGLAIVVLMGGQDKGLVQSLQVELADTKAAYLSLQVEVAQSKVAALSLQLGDISAAESRLAQLVTEKESTLAQLTVANQSLMGLMGSDVVNAAIEDANVVVAEEVTIAKETAVAPEQSGNESQALVDSVDSI